MAMYAKATGAMGTPRPKQDEAFLVTVGWSLAVSVVSSMEKPCPQKQLTELSRVRAAVWQRMS